MLYNQIEFELIEGVAWFSGQQSGVSHYNHSSDEGNLRYQDLESAANEQRSPTLPHLTEPIDQSRKPTV